MNERQLGGGRLQESVSKPFNNHYGYEASPITRVHTADQPLRKLGRYDVGMQPKERPLSPPYLSLKETQERNPVGHNPYYPPNGSKVAMMEQVAMNDRTHSAGHFDMAASRPTRHPAAGSLHEAFITGAQANHYSPGQSQHRNPVKWQPTSQQIPERSLPYPHEPNHRQYIQYQTVRPTGTNVERRPEHGSIPIGVGSYGNNYPMTASAVATMRNHPSGGVPVPDERAIHQPAHDETIVSRMAPAEHADHIELAKYARHPRQDNSTGKYPGTYSMMYQPGERPPDAGRSYPENVPQGGPDSLLYFQQRDNEASHFGAYGSLHPNSVSRQQTVVAQGQDSKPLNPVEMIPHNRRTNPAYAAMYPKLPPQATDQRRSASISYHLQRSPHAAAPASGLGRARLQVNEAREDISRKSTYGSYSESDTGLVPIEPNVQPRLSGSLAGPTAKWPGTTAAYADIVNMKSYYDNNEPHTSRIAPGKRTFPFEMAEGDSLAKKLSPLVVNESFRGESKRAAVHQYMVAPRSGSFSPGSTCFRPTVVANRVSDDDNAAALDLTVKPEQSRTANRKYPWSSPEGLQNQYLPDEIVGGRENIQKASSRRPENRFDSSRGGVRGNGMVPATNETGNLREPGMRESIGYNLGNVAAAANVRHASPGFSTLFAPDGSAIAREGLPRHIAGGWSVEHALAAGSGKPLSVRPFHEVTRSRANTLDHQLRPPTRSYDNQYGRLNSQNTATATRNHENSQSSQRQIDAPQFTENPSIIQAFQRDKMVDVVRPHHKQLEVSPWKVSIDKIQSDGTGKCATTMSPNIPHLSPIDPLYQPSSSNTSKDSFSSAQTSLPISNIGESGTTTGGAKRRIPIVPLLGTHDPGDILDLECKLCHSTHGSLRSFRIHFAKAHGLDPTADNFVVHTISDAKKAKAGSPSLSTEAEIGNDRDPPALMREAPLESNSQTMLSSAKHDIVERPKQIAEVLPMLLSRQKLPPSTVDHSPQCRKDSGDDSVSRKPDDKGAQCMRCQWLSPSPHNLDVSGPIGRPRSDVLSGEAHCTTCMEGNAFFHTKSYLQWLKLTKPVCLTNFTGFFVCILKN